MPRRFQISADRIGPRRWCWVVIHPTIAHFHNAAARTAPHHDRGWWNGCLGCFQPAWYRERHVDDTWIGHWPANGYAGVLRLINGHVTAEIVAHELVHAATQIYRMNTRPSKSSSTHWRHREWHQAELRHPERQPPQGSRRQARAEEGLQEQVQLIMVNVPERYQRADEQVDIQRCAFGDDHRGYCGERAVEHIYVSKISGFGTMACEKHKVWFDTHYAHDRHPVVGPCGLPGTIWVNSNDDGPGWCEFEGFDGLETAVAEAEVAQPAPAMTM